MDAFPANGFKELVVSRGFKYRYYSSPADVGKPTLLLVHGFPAFAKCWYNQEAYFRTKGYGLILPDSLGHGGSDKPADVGAYASTALAKDLLEIMDHEAAFDVFAIGHNWGSKTVSALANLYPNRFLGFGFLSLSYLPPKAGGRAEAASQEKGDYADHGDWGFYCSDEANEVITSHIDSFVNRVHAKDNSVWTLNARAFLESDSKVEEIEGLTEDFRQAWKSEWSGENGGFDASLNYYRVIRSGLDSEDAKNIAPSSYNIEKPVFFGAATRDMQCRADVGKILTSKFCSQATVHEFNTGHWIYMEAADELNNVLENWVVKVANPPQSLAN